MARRGARVDGLRFVGLIAAATFARAAARMLDARRDAAASLPTATTSAGIAIVLDLAREAQIAQLDQLTRLDATASGLIGFAGVVLGLLFTSDVATSHWTWSLSLSALLLGGSVLPLAYALMPRRYNFNPNIGSFEDLFAAAPTQRAQAAAVKSIRRSIDRNGFFVARKTRAIRTGMTMIAGAVAIVGVFGVYDRERLHRVPARPDPLSLEEPSAVVSASPRRRMGGRIAVERGRDTRCAGAVHHRHRCRSRGARGGDSPRRNRAATRVPSRRALTR
jgi:hypothetical protein